MSCLAVRFEKEKEFPFSACGMSKVALWSCHLQVQVDLFVNFQKSLKNSYPPWSDAAKQLVVITIFFNK